MAKQPQTPTPATGSDQQTVDEPVDLNTATVVLAFGGAKFEVPKRRGRWPIEAILQFNRGQTIRGIRELLGADDWARLKKVCPTGDDFDRFADYAVDVLLDQCVL